MADPAKLTPKQRKFMEAYMGPALGNAKKAAELAGYKGTDNTLRAVGSENLRKPAIRVALENAGGDPAEARHMKVPELMEWWSDLATDDDVPYAIRLKASEYLAKAQAAFVARVEQSGPDGGPIQTAAKTTLTKETAATIRREILGISDDPKEGAA